MSETHKNPRAPAPTPVPAAAAPAPAATEGRRDFLKVSAAAATAAAAPMVVPSTVFAKPAPSDKVIIGSIGVGDLGRRHHLNVLMGNDRVEVAAVCDVDRNHRDQAAKDVFNRKKKRVGVYDDFRDLCDRKDIDAVMVVTPDHWHALCSIYAMESGKDVYCEKPLTLTIAEGQKMVEVARRYGTVFQTGSQQRSDREWLLAAELVRNKKIGTLKNVETRIGGVGGAGWHSPTTPGPELDWSFWLGPAPWREYVKEYVHYQFRWFSDFSGGKLTDWGAHHNDAAQWGIGADGSGPISVEPVAAKFHQDGPYDVASHFHVRYTYGPEHGNVTLDCYDGEKDGYFNKAHGGNNGVRFNGTDGYVFVSRGYLEGKIGGKLFSSDRKQIAEGKHGDVYKEFQPNALGAVKLYRVQNGHHNNWLDCITTRERPICDVEVGHRSASVCHLGNIAIKLGRKLTWDPKAEQFTNDEAANRLTFRPMRAPWTL